MKLKVLTPIFAETASIIVNTTSKYEKSILIKKGNWLINAKSLLGIVAVALKPGEIIEFSMELDDEEVVSELYEMGLFEKEE